jgi:hypothetical protein
MSLTAKDLQPGRIYVRNEVMTTNDNFILVKVNQGGVLEYIDLFTQMYDAVVHKYFDKQYVIIKEFAPVESSSQANHRYIITSEFEHPKYINKLPDFSALVGFYDLIDLQEGKYTNDGITWFDIEAVEGEEGC